MCYVAIALAYNFMWRASEFIYSKSDDVHALLRDDCTCYDADGGVVQSFNDTSIVVRMTFVIKSSKADQYGRGRYLSLDRNGECQSQLIDDILFFLEESGTRSGDVLMSRWRKGRNLKLTRKVVTTVLKEAARHFNVDEVCITLHSLRIGGATQLTALDSDPDMVDRVGGWSTSAAGRSKLYRRGTSMDYGAVGAIDRSNGATKMSDRCLCGSRVTREGRQVEWRGAVGGCLSTHHPDPTAY
jgi:hypothetical protein